jgi:hypothetical protein
MANLIQSIVQLALLFGVPVVLLSIVAVVVVMVVLLYMYFKRDKFVDALEVIYKDHVRVAKINKPESLTSLWMVYHDGTEPLKKGRLTGYNRVSLLTSYDELYQTELDESGKDQEVIRLDSKTKFVVKQGEKDRVTKLISECGQFLHVIVYEYVSGYRALGLWPIYTEKALLCFEDEITRSYGDGRLVINGPGTEEHGFFFEVVSGSRDRLHVAYSVIQTFTWIRALAKTQGNLFDVADRAIEINPALTQILMGKQAEKPSKTVIQKAE